MAVTAPTLFRSVREALGAGGDDALATADPVDVFADESVMQELRDWWRSGPWGSGESTTTSWEHYERFYRQLVDALTQQQVLSLEGPKEELIAQWIDADWVQDQHELWQRETAFVGTMQTIASRCMNTESELLAVVKKLRACVDASIPVHAEKRPMTMAEKLSHMRSKRSALVKESSAANLPPSATAFEPTPLAVSGEGSTPISCVSMDSLRGEEDASHYFTIETRAKLKVRLVILQRRLDELLLQTKLAWMKCFAHPQSDNSEQNTLAAQDSDQAIAAQLVADGETLAFLLLDVFEKARKGTYPISEYKSLVATCEDQFDAFQALVSSTAAAPSPVRSKHVPASVDTQPIDPSAVHKPHLASFDLPSMKAYYEKAAPSYAAYLPKKKTR